MKRYQPNIFMLCCSLMLLYSQCGKEPVRIDDPIDENAYCDSLEAARIVDDYTFPVLPGTPEWEELSGEQRDSVLQIPEETLKNMCTHGLIETCFNWPDLWLCTIYEQFTVWWYTVEFSFNGIPALAARPDAPEKMLRHYLTFNEYPYADSITNFSPKMEIKARLTFMELFLARENILEGLSPGNKILLGVKAKELWHLKNKYMTIVQSISPTYSCFILGRMMYYDHYEPFMQEVDNNDDLYRFVTTGSYIFYYNDSFEDIINNIDAYLSQL